MKPILKNNKMNHNGEGHNVANIIAREYQTYSERRTEKYKRRDEKRWHAYIMKESSAALPAADADE